MAKKRKKPLNSTFLKKPLDSIAVHIGKFIDRLDGKSLIDLLLYGTAAYYGYKAFKDQPHGAAVGAISLKLATSMNAAAGVAGVSGLVMIGLGNMLPSDILEQSYESMKTSQTTGIPGYYVDPFTHAMQEDIAALEAKRKEELEAARENSLVFQRLVEQFGYERASEMWK